MRPIYLAVLSLLTTSLAADNSAALQLRDAELGQTRNVHAFGTTLLCGQPSTEAFAEAKRRGIEVVITLREEDEIDWDEAAVVKQLGLQFHPLGFNSPDSLTDEIFQKSLNLLAQSKDAPVMLHCASANRVGAVWLAHRVLNDDLDLVTAEQEAKEVGLRTPTLKRRALEYIRSEQSK